MKYTEEHTCLEVNLCFPYCVFSHAVLGWKPRIKSFSSSQVSKESGSDDLPLSTLFEG